MSDFETIDSTALESVNGGALPIKPIIKLGEKGIHAAKEVYNDLAKPLLKKAYDGLNIAGNIATVGNAIHDGWNYMFGPKQPAPQAPQPQPQGHN